MPDEIFQHLLRENFHVYNVDITYVSIMTTRLSLQR